MSDAISKEEIILIGLYERVRVNKVTKHASVYYVNSDEEILAKKCCNCENVYLLDNFRNRSTGIAGKEARCKVCKGEKDRLWRENNPEYFKMYHEQHRDEQLQKMRDRRKVKGDIYNKNKRDKYPFIKEEILKRNREWSANNREYKRESVKKWREVNKEQQVVQGQRKRAYKRLLPATLTNSEALGLLQDQSGLCLLTRSSECLHLEHFIPLSWGHGGTTLQNCYWISSDLNLSKNALNPFEWIKRQEKEIQERFFERLVPDLSARLGMTVEEFEEYVYWCEGNKRNIDDLVNLDNPSTEGGSLDAI